MRLQLLGRMAYNHQVVEMPRKARALLAYVAVPELPRQRDELMALFCTNTVDPRRTLRTLLSHIRREAPGVLLTTRERIALNEAVWVDCKAFSEAVRQDSLTPGMLALCAEAFMAGEALPDCPEYEIWLLGRRAYYQSLYEQALLTLAQTHYQQGETEAAHSYAMQLVERNPYLEEGHALLIQMLAAEGRLAEARTYADHFCALLKQELGMAPTEDFLQLAATVSPSTPDEPAQRRPTVSPVLVAPPAPQASLLFSPHRLQQRLGDHAQEEQWATLREWAVATVESAFALWAYQDAAAALDVALFAAERMNAPPAEQAAILGQRVLLGRYVDEPLPVQQQWFARAEALLAKPPGTPAPPILELARATLLHREGHYSLAIEAAEAIAETFKEAGDYALAGQARAVQGQALLRTGRNSVAETVLQQARSWLAEAGDAEGLGLSIGETAWAALNRGRVEDAFAIVEAGLSELGPSGPPAAEARLFYTLAACWNYYYDADGMERAARRAIECYERIGNQALATRCEIYLLQAERYRFQTEAAQKRLGNLFHKAQRYHDTWLMAWVMALLGQAAFRKGDLSEAENWYSRAYGLRQQTSERQNQIYDLSWAGRLRAALGRKKSALHYTTTAVRKMEQAADEYFVWEAWDVYLAHAEALAQNGREQEALASLEVAYQTLQAFIQHVPSPVLRQQILAFEHSRHLVTARRSQLIIPFHQRHHHLI